MLFYLRRSFSRKNILYLIITSVLIEQLVVSGKISSDFRILEILRNKLLINLSKLKEGIKKSGVPDTVVIDNGSTFDAPKCSETVTTSKKEFSNPSWTIAPRLAIDEHGISLSGVYLPGTTRFSLKDSGDLDGTFILDIETDVVLATAPVEKTVAEHENPVAKKKAPQEENAESVIDYISGFDFEMSAKIQSSVSDLLSKTRSKHS